VSANAEHEGPAAAVDLERALAQLGDTARVVVWLHDVEGYTHAEIGALLGGTASLSKSQLARAHQRLRELLEPGGVTASCMPASTTY
jgi:RNA polymerase sigma-70 factor (ECF subfamily)